jgi:hypothetical protein
MNKSQLKELIKEEIKKVLKEEKSRKRGFLGIFNPGKDQFQRIIKKVDSSLINNLIKYTESNGDEVERYGNNAWALSNDSRAGDQMLWSYDDGDLLFVNPNYPSVYDTYIRNLSKHSS